MTAPFFLAYGLTRGAYIGTEAAAAHTMHVTKAASYGAGDLLTAKVMFYGAALTPATVAGAALFAVLTCEPPDPRALAGGRGGGVQPPFR